MASDEELMQAQCWICPKCFDDHRRDGPCTPKQTHISMDAHRAICDRLAAENEKLREEHEALKVRYDERGACMRDTGDVVRSLYAGSEVSKRILNLREENDRLRAALDRAKEALTHYAGDGESSEHISFYRGLRIKPKDALAEIERLERGEAGT